MTTTRSALKAAILEGLQCTDCDRPSVDIHRPDPELGYIEGNMVPLCKGCHTAIHGNEALLSDLKLVTRLYYESQESRKRIANRVKAYGDLDIPVPMADSALDDCSALEDKFQRYVVQMLKHNGFYNAWLKHIKGIGPMLGASLIAEIGEIGRFRHVRSLWHYAGLHVVDGKATKKKRGQKSTWNGRLRTTAWKCASQFVTTRGSFGRRLYDDHKAEEVAKNEAKPDRPKGTHPNTDYKAYAAAVARGERLIPLYIDNRARRRVAKDLLRCLWAKWRKLEGLPVTEPREGTWPMAEDWVGDQANLGLRSHARSAPSPTLALFDQQGDSE